MNAAQPIPTSLKVVAALFIVAGISSLIEIIVSLFHNRISINLGVLNLFIGVGLLRLSPTWRMWALVFTWLALVGVPLVGLYFLTSPDPLDFSFFGQKVAQVPKAAGVALAVASFSITLWQYRVLTRPDIRALFRLSAAESFAGHQRSRQDDLSDGDPSDSSDR
jgi:hypothetical protein